MIGAIAQAAPAMGVTTAVTCPTIRIHPAVIARAALYVNQIGPDQDAFFAAYENEVLPRLRWSATSPSLG
jgi:hypothetical protein